MKSKLLWALAGLLLLLTGCGSGEYELLNPASEITAIEIVQFDAQFDVDTATGGTVLAVIDDHAAFVDGLRSLKCYTITPLSSPVSIDLQAHPIVKISYANGEYELASCTGQGRYIINNGVGTYLNLGYYSFNEDEYMEFIEKYIK